MLYRVDSSLENPTVVHMLSNAAVLKCDLKFVWSLLKSRKHDVCISGFKRRGVEK